MKVFILKLWYVACTLFCLYNLNTLVSERYELANVAISRKKIDPILLLTCAKFSDLHLSKTEISLGGSSGDLYQHFKTSFYYKRYRDSEDDEDDFDEYILAPLQSRNYRIFNDMLCFTVKYQWEAYKTARFLYHPVFFAFKNSTADFVQLPSPYYLVDQLVVLKKGPPYSNCTESNSRNRCLNECFKARFRLSHYFYEGSEVGRVHLRPATNQTIEDNEKRCFRKCWRENCEMVQLSPNPDFYRKEPRTTTLEAQPKLSEFDFWVQFIGLVCSFANISLNQVASLLIQFASSKAKRRKVRIGLFCLKWAIFLFGLIYRGYLYTIMTIDHQAEKENPNKKEIMKDHVKQKTMHLVICAKVGDYLSSGYRLDFNSLNNFNSLNKTMSEIEKATDRALDGVLKGVYVNYQERLFRMNFIPEPKVLFKKVVSLNRCFSLLILPDYQLMPSNPKLIIKFKVRRVDLKLYILTENENLSEKSFEYEDRLAFKKKIVRRLKYNEKRVDHLNCVGRQHCVERCINRETLKKFKEIVIDKVVVDKEHYSPEEWNGVYSMEISYDLSEYNKIVEECEKKFPEEKPLEEVKFEKTVKIIPPDDHTMEIDLFLDDEKSIEEFTWFNLLLNLMNIQSIFFGMTVLKLLRMLYSFIKSKSEFLDRMRNEKISKFLIYLLCSFGFTWHTYLILELSINEELTYNLNYEIADRVQMPNLVFCHRIDEKLIDRNHQLNGNYLDQVTNEIIAESVFSSIIYLNKSNEWTPFNLSQVERFFFLNLKCFRIETHQEYDDRNQFHFSPNRLAPNVLKVIFTNKLLNQEKKKTVFFMTKTNETGFSNVLNLHYDYSPRFPMDQYSIDQSKLTVNYEDHLSLIKRWLSTLYEDRSVDQYQQLFQLEYNEYNIKTLKIPLEKKDFDIELGDDLFDQLFSQAQNTRAHNFLGSYQQTSVFNSLRIERSDSDLTFSVNLIKKTLSTKNEAKLILGLLNVLFWFDLGILDIHPIFVYFYAYLLILLPIYLLNKITQFLLFSHRWLKKYECPLYKRLNARKQNSSGSPKSPKPSSISVLPD